MKKTFITKFASTYEAYVKIKNELDRDENVKSYEVKANDGFNGIGIGYKIEVETC